MKNYIKINYKNLVRSYWPFVFYGPLIAFFIFTQVYLNYFKENTLGFWTATFSYGDVLFLALCFSLGVYEMHSFSDYDRSLPFGDFSTLASKFISGLFLASYYVVFTTLYLAVVGAVFSYSFAYILNICVNNFIIKLCAALCGISAGFFAGSVTRKKLAYLLVVFPLHLFTLFFRTLLIPVVTPYRDSTFLNVLYDYPYFAFNTAVGNVYDMYYLSDKLFAPLISAVFISGALIFFTKAKKRRYLTALFLCTALVLCAYGYNKSKAYHYYFNGEFVNQDRREKTLEDYSCELSIENISMDISIGENLKNAFSIELYNPTDKNIDSVKFNLNGSLKVKSVKIGDSSAKYSRSGDELTINVNSAPGSQTEISVVYEGDLKEKTNPGILSFFSSNYSSNLVYSGNWYPLLKNEQDLDFKIRVKHKNRLISNLDDFQIHKPGTDEISGKAKYLYISTGFYDEKIYDGIRFVGSEEVIKNYFNKYKEKFDFIAADDVAVKSVKTALFVPASFADYVLLDNSILIPEN